MSPKLVQIESWPVAVSGFGDEEPRIRDIELAERLGYKRVADIRELIARLIRDGKLNDSEVIRTVRKSPEGGRPATEFWLTEAQALKVVAKSETAKADALLDEVINVFVLARRGLLPAPVPHLTESQAKALVIRNRGAIEIMLLAKEYFDDYAIKRTVETAVERVGGHELAKPQDPTLEVTGYLQAKGMSADIIRRKAASFGKKLKKLYQKTRGHDPASSTKFINGADRSAMLYHQSDLPLFDEVFGEMFGAAS